MTCVTFSRVIVFLLNLLMLLVALAVIALALWIRLDDDFEYQIRQGIKMTNDMEPLSAIKSDMRTGITVSFWVIIGFAAACAIFGFMGMLGGCVRSRALLVLYFVCMLVVVLLEIAIGIYVLVKRKDVRNTVKSYVAYSFQYNTQDVTAILSRYSCCGIENQPNLNCIQGTPTCTGAVWDRLDYTMMVFGISMIVVVVLQAVALALTIPIFAQRKRETSTY